MEKCHFLPDNYHRRPIYSENFTPPLLCLRNEVYASLGPPGVSQGFLKIRLYLPTFPKNFCENGVNRKLWAVTLLIVFLHQYPHIAEKYCLFLSSSNFCIFLTLHDYSGAYYIFHHHTVLFRRNVYLQSYRK